MIHSVLHLTLKQFNVFFLMKIKLVIIVLKDAVIQNDERENINSCGNALICLFL